MAEIRLSTSFWEKGSFQHIIEKKGGEEWNIKGDFEIPTISWWVTIRGKVKENEGLVKCKGFDLDMSSIKIHGRDWWTYYQFDMELKKEVRDINYR